MTCSSRNALGGAVALSVKRINLAVVPNGPLRQCGKRLATKAGRCMHLNHATGKKSAVVFFTNRAVKPRLSRRGYKALRASANQAGRF